MIASLPMYACPSNRAAHDALWALIRDGLRDRGLDAPEALDHHIAYDAVWARSDLVLGHICNLPLRARFAGRVTVIGASDYGLPGCAPGYYTSLFVARPDGPDSLSDPAAQVFACNDLLSQSGYGAAVDAGLPGMRVCLTGSHRGSIAAVAAGKADLASIDAQIWRTVLAEMPEAQGLRVIGQSAATPGMTFITRAGQDPAPYLAAITDAIGGLAPSDKALLDLRGIAQLPQMAYHFALPLWPEVATPTG